MTKWTDSKKWAESEGVYLSLKGDGDKFQGFVCGDPCFETSQDMRGKDRVRLAVPFGNFDSEPPCVFAMGKRAAKRFLKKFKPEIAQVITITRHGEKGDQGTVYVFDVAGPKRDQAGRIESFGEHHAAEILNIEEEPF